MLPPRDFDYSCLSPTLTHFLFILLVPLPRILLSTHTFCTPTWSKSSQQPLLSASCTHVRLSSLRSIQLPPHLYPILRNPSIFLSIQFLQAKHPRCSTSLEKCSQSPGRIGHYSVSLYLLVYHSPSSEHFDRSKALVIPIFILAFAPAVQFIFVKKPSFSIFSRVASRSSRRPVLQWDSRIDQNTSFLTCQVSKQTTRRDLLFSMVNIFLQTINQTLEDSC